MDTKTIKSDVINIQLKSFKFQLKKSHLIAAILLLIMGATATANYVLPFVSSITANEVTYKDPANPNNFITFNHAEHTFYSQQNGETYSGPYSETSQAYSVNGAIGTTIKKIGTDKIENPGGQPWVKK